MTDSEQNNDVAPEADGMKNSSGARGFFAVTYKLAVLVLLVVFVVEVDQIRQELQSGSINANVKSVWIRGGSVGVSGTVDANVDFPSRQSVYVSGGSVDANVDFPSTGVQDVQIVAIKKGFGMAWSPVDVNLTDHSIRYPPLPVSVK